MKTLDKEQLVAILWAVKGVDGDCPYCESYVIERLGLAFPDAGLPGLDEAGGVDETNHAEDVAVFNARMFAMAD